MKDEVKAEMSREEVVQSILAKEEGQDETTADDSFADEASNDADEDDSGSEEAVGDGDETGGDAAGDEPAETLGVEDKDTLDEKDADNSEEKDLEFDDETVNKAIASLTDKFSELEELGVIDEDDGAAELVQSVTDTFAQMAATIDHQNKLLAGNKSSIESMQQEKTIDTLLLDKKYANVPAKSRADIATKVNILLAGNKGMGQDAKVADVFNDAVRLVVPEGLLNGKTEKVRKATEKRSRLIIGRGSNNTGTDDRVAPTTHEQIVANIIAEAGAL